MKKLLTLFTVILMLCLVLTGCEEIKPEPETVTTSYESQLGCMNLTLGDNGWIIDKITDHSITSIEIPAEHNGKPISTIKKEAFLGCTALKSITIPNNINYVGSYAFKDCMNLESLYVKNKDTLIEETAFEGCDITVAQISTEHIEALPASNLEEIYLLSGTVEQAAFRGFYSLRVIGVAGDVTFTEYALEACHATTFKLPPNKIKDFSHKNRVFSLIVSPSLTGSSSTIQASAFEGYSILSNVTFEKTENGYTLSDSAFENCIATSFTVDASMISKLPTNTETLTVSSGSIEYLSSTRNLSLKTLIIDKDVTFIAPGAFMECTELRSVSLVAGVGNINEYTFSKCYSLESISFGAGITGISANAFANCTSLKKINIASDIKTVGENAFKGCTALTDVTLRSCVTTVEKSAFDGCKSLTNLSIGSGLTSLDLTAFLNCGAISNISVDSSNTAYKLVSGALLTYDGKTLIKFSKGEAEFTIPSGVETIYEQAFMGNTTLKTLVFSSTVKEIGKNAFEGCISLETVTLNETLETVSESAFKECEALKSTCIPASVKVIEKDAFYGCDALESVTLSLGLTEIGKTAFYNCNALLSIEIPSTIELIGERAFASCDSLEVIFLVNVSDTKDLGENWSSGTDAAIIYKTVKE